MKSKGRHVTAGDIPTVGTSLCSIRFLLCTLDEGAEIRNGIPVKPAGYVPS